jgi:hypothetical protein
MCAALCDRLLKILFLLQVHLALWPPFPKNSHSFADAAKTAVLVGVWHAAIARVAFLLSA